jgi:hypothetical protein
MKSLLASPRKRRRLIWAGVALLVLVVCIGLSAALWDTGGRLKIDKSVPAGRQIPTGTGQEQVAFTHETERSVNAVLQRFVDTAVARKELSAAYDLTTPAMRQGMTRSEWSKGTIPVPSYPADRIQIGRIISSVKNDVVLEAALEPQAGASAPLLDVQVELKAVGRGTGRRWLIDSFGATGVIPGSERAHSRRKSR